MFKVINKTNLFPKNEMEEILKLLPKEYQQMELTIQLVHEPKQIFNLLNLTKKSIWNVFRHMKHINGYRGSYLPELKTINIFTENVVKDTINYAQDINVRIDKQHPEHSDKLPLIVASVMMTIKPQVLLTLFHEMQHAYQHQCLQKTFDNESDYLEQWQEIDADQFAQQFSNEHQHQIKEILQLPFAFGFVYDRKKEIFNIEVEMDKDNTISIEMASKQIA